MKYLLLLIGFNSLLAQTISYNFENKLINTENTENYILPKNFKKYTNEGFYTLGTNFFGLFSALEKVDGKGKMERLFALPYDKYNRANQNLVGEPISLLEVDEFATYHKYRFNYSVDSSKFLVTYVVAPKKNNVRKNKDVIGFYLYDNNLKKIFSTEIEMPYTEFEMNNLDYFIDSKGEIYALIEANVDGNDINWDQNTVKRNEIPKRFEILKINKSKNSLESIKINLADDKVANSFIFSENKEKELFISGYYSTNKDFNLSIGAYMIGLKQDVNSELANSYIYYYPFSIENLKLNVDNPNNQVDNIKPDNLKINKIIQNQDGSNILIGEEYVVGIGLNFSNNDAVANTRSYNHTYGDIIVSKFDINGKIFWTKRIPKSQSAVISQSSFYNGEQYRSDLSFYHHRYKSEDYFFYFDNLKNSNLGLDVQPAHFASGDASYLSCVKLTNDGKIEKTAVFDLNTKDRRIYPSKFKSISGSLIVFNLGQKILRIEIK